MRRVRSAWSAADGEQRLAAISSLALLVSMFLPWYGLQSLDRRTGALYAHDISAFGDVSFVEAAIFLVAAGVAAMLLARVEGRLFRVPGGDGTIVAAAGGWAVLLIFYRVFDRPAGGGYPVGIEWGFFLAFMEAGAVAYAGLRMRSRERPEPPMRRARGERERARERPHEPPRERARAQERGPEAWRAPATQATEARSQGPGEMTPGAPAASTPAASAQAPARRAAAAAAGPEQGARKARPRYPPAPGEQLSFEDPATRQH